MNILKITPTHREELAWAAGFLDGEACFKFYTANNDKGRGRLAVTVAQVRREPLDRLATLFGGTVRGPYGPYQNSKQAHFQWDTSSYERAETVIESIWPWLSDPKREQALQAIEEYKNRRPGKPHTNILKTTCIRGHDLTNTDNIYQPPKGGRQCKLCNKIRKTSKKVGTNEDM